MDTKYTKEELIDMYVADALDKDDKEDFEKRMAQDEALRREVEFARHITNAVERKGEQKAVKELHKIDSVEEFRRILSGAESKYRPKGRRIALRRWVISAAAAVASIVIIVGLQPRYSTQQLFSMSYETPVYYPVVSRGGEKIAPELKQMLDRAGEVYETGDMEKVVALYGKAQEMSPSGDMPDDARFYHAVALAETGMTEKALAGFSRLAADGESEYSEEAAWQIALLYLKKGDRKHTKEILRAIIASDGIYADDARQLLAEIEKTRFFK